jgi:hypothetical protein
MHYVRWGDNEPCPRQCPIEDEMEHFDEFCRRMMRSGI